MSQQMNQRVKRVWVADLRSGKDKQVTGSLQTKDGHCCWGVLCELHAEETGGQFEWDDDGMFLYYSEPKMPPIEVVKWAGLLHPIDSQVMINGLTRTLAVHNDYGVTFDQIADAIEAQL